MSNRNLGSVLVQAKVSRIHAARRSQRHEIQHATVSRPQRYERVTLDRGAVIRIRVRQVEYWS
jgi:hypothetical protein